MTRILLFVWSVFLFIGAGSGGCSSTEPYQTPRLSQSDIMGEWGLVREETRQYYGDSRDTPTDVVDWDIPNEVLVIDASTFTEYTLNGNCYLVDSYDYELTIHDRLTNDTGEFDFTEDLGDGVALNHHTSVTIDNSRLAIREVSIVSSSSTADYTEEVLRFFESQGQGVPPSQWPDVACD